MSFFVNFRISSFFVFSTFFEQKKTFVLKSLLFLSLKKKVSENVLKFDLCHTSPFVFNSCITYFSFLPRLRNISSMFLNLVSGELPSFFCFFVFFFSSFHPRFFVSPSCESSILLTSVFFLKKKTPRVLHSLLILSSFFFHFFITFLLSSCRLLFWLDFSMVSLLLVRLKKTFSSHFLSPLCQFFSISLFPNPLFFVFFTFISFFFSLLFFFPFFSFFHSCHGIHGHR